MKILVIGKGLFGNYVTEMLADTGFRVQQVAARDFYVDDLLTKYNSDVYLTICKPEVAEVCLKVLKEANKFTIDLTPKTRLDDDTLLVDYDWPAVEKTRHFSTPGCMASAMKDLLGALYVVPNTMYFDTTVGSSVAGIEVDRYQFELSMFSANKVHSHIREVQNAFPEIDVANLTPKLVPTEHGIVMNIMVETENINFNCDSSLLGSPKVVERTNPDALVHPFKYIDSDVSRLIATEIEGTEYSNLTCITHNFKRLNIHILKALELIKQQR